MKRRACGAVSAWMALAVLHAAAVAQAPEAPADAAPASAQAGRRAYTSYCARCHGIRLVTTGSAFFDLRNFPREDKARFLNSVNNGKRAMPAWEGIVKPQDIESIWLYIGEVNGWPAPNAPEAPEAQGAAAPAATSAAAGGRWPRKLANGRCPPAAASHVQPSPRAGGPGSR